MGGGGGRGCSKGRQAGRQADSSRRWHDLPYHKVPKSSEKPDSEPTDFGALRLGIKHPSLTPIVLKGHCRFEP